MESYSLDVSYESMDIDLSSNSIKNIDVSLCESEEPEKASSFNSMTNTDISVCESEGPEKVSRSTSPLESIKTHIFRRKTYHKKALNKTIKKEPPEDGLTTVPGNDTEIKALQPVKKYHMKMQPKKKPEKYNKALNKTIKKEPPEDGLTTVPGNDTEIKALQPVKKYHIKMQPKKKPEKSKTWMKFSILFVLLASVFIYHVNTLTCCEEQDLNNFRDTLHSKLYGQDRAIHLLTRALDTKVSSKILFLYGGTGVGKTYATSLIFGKVWNWTNVYYYLMPSFMETFSNDLLLGMSFCKSSIFIVDDLMPKDFHIKEHIRNVIDKSVYMKKNITVILIYNSDHIEKNFMKHSNTAFFEFELRDAFSDMDAYKEFIKFEPLTEKHLKLCIKTELGYSNVANMEEIVKNFNATQDGCKGVHNKMKLLNIV